jgi:colanic acid biosynthesis glycosyl transferase WcaI
MMARVSRPRRRNLKRPEDDCIAGTLLIISQVFPPDPAAVGQYMLDAARTMRRRGHFVRVITANRGYEDPSRRYDATEVIDGVQIRRLPFSSFGKKPIHRRLLGTVSFMVQCFWRTLTMRNLGGVLFSTSPPMVGFVVSIAAMIRRVPTAYWAMDLNPDQLIALHKIQPAGMTARLLESINRLILKRAAVVISLDRFMAGRLRERASLEEKLVIIPPWPHEHYVAEVTRRENPFRIEQGFGAVLVVMYSGNHTSSNPLTTLLQATLAFKDDPRIIFAFVGGGQGKAEIDAHIADHGAANVRSIPYQPLEALRYSLGAADVHVVSLGEQMVGIVHPCKIYGAMAAARPVLFFGPEPSHISELLAQHPFGWHVQHGDVSGAVSALQKILATPPDDLRAMGQLARRTMEESLSQQKLCGQFCDALEKYLRVLPCRAEG